MSETTTIAAAGTTTQPRFAAFNADGNAVALGADDHVITRDTSTGLEYTAAGQRGGYLEHEAAMQACTAVAIAGGGWRAPTRAELIAITDITRHAPAIDAEAFPFVSDDWYWSSDLAAWSSSAAWGVLFDGGLVSSLHRHSVGFALAVRRAGQ